MNRDLELAKLVFPDSAEYWFEYMDDVYWQVDGDFDADDAVAFDPLGKHFPDVLAWLLTKYEATVNGDDVTVYIGNQQYAYTPHDGTAAGIAQAVYEAAIRIVEAEK